MVLLTTGSRLHEVQNYVDRADVIISVYPGEVRILRAQGQDLTAGLPV